MNHTFGKALRAVLVAAMVSLTGSHALAQSTGVVVNGNVFGGGNLAEVKGRVTVNIKAGTVVNDVYGGGAKANTNSSINTITQEDGKDVYPTTVNLTGGTIGNAYGGGLGEIAGVNGGTEDKEALVYGDVLVNVNGTAFTQTYDEYTVGSGENETTVQVPKTGRVFGCNNLNGSPKKTVTVHVYQTVPVGGGEHQTGVYEIAAVYGGGNEAAYEPTISGTETDASHAHTNVIVDGCSLTSIKQVYGGGNAASTPSTQVTINGAFEIDEVFGGGNGNDKIKRTNGSDVSWLVNPGANVGFYAYDADSEDYDTSEERAAMAYGFGKAKVNINGGIIHYVYGGSNAKGNVRQVAVAMLEKTSDEDCFTVDEAYGGGKAAEMDGRAELQLGCIPGVGTVYGGARAATVNNGVVLTITNGTYNNVFGGNNEKGLIKGTITINVEETGCRPIHITNLYGGGNLAPYTAPANENGPTLNIKSFTSIEHIYGGGYGEGADVTGDVTVNINVLKGRWAGKTVYGETVADALGTIGDVYGGGYGADVIGNVEVNIGTEETIGFVTEPTYLGSGNYSYNSTTKLYEGVDGSTNVVGAIITGNVFGGGFGAETTVTGDVAVNVGGQKADGTFIGNITIGGSTNGGNVYGGSALGAVNAEKSGNSLVGTKKVINDPDDNTQTIEVPTETKVTLKKGNITGAVFGGGKGEAGTSSGARAVDGNLGAPASSGTEAQVYGNTTVTLYGDVVAGGLYGGCDVNGRLHGNTELNLYGGTVGTALAEGASAPDIVFGGGLGKATKVDGNVTVNVGNAANTGTTIYSNVYGGSAEGTVNSSASNTTTVNLFKGIIHGDVFGGGKGVAGQEAKAAVGTEGEPGYQPAVPAITPIPAYVKGSVRVNLNGYAGMDLEDETAFGTCVVTGNIFGCNNANGSPEGDVEVHIYKTIGIGSNVRSTDKDNSTFDLAAVYGGGNEAAYTASGKTANVVIETCDVSVETVYGGGNAAKVPATRVDVNGAYEIGTVFGGGNGADDLSNGDPNPGADVDGSTYVSLQLGTIHEAYGGSNTKGVIQQGSTMDVNDSSVDPSDEDACHLKVDKVYGGGKEAGMKGGTNIILRCQPDKWVEEIYAGSQMADVEGNVSLTITSGKFERVFGGNKTSGKIYGSITVNIEETGTCGTPIVIGELYGGGYQAKYSIYGYNDDGSPRTKAQYESLKARITGKTDAEIEANNELKAIKEELKDLPYKQPQLNVRSFTSIGAIYGGGFEADMVADPTVSINVVEGSLNDDATIHTGANDTYPVVTAPATTPTTPFNSLPYPVHTKGSIGVIGNVFGGGNLAEVDGSTTVNIGTETKVEMISLPKVDAEEGDPEYDSEATEQVQVYQKKTVLGANITGNVYGGGNQADVTGDTQVNICVKKGTGDTYTSVAFTTTQVTIGGDVFGAGKGVETDVTKALVEGTSIVKMGGGSVAKSVYGGGELSQVGGDTDITVMGGTIGTTDLGGATYGNIYGGGFGSTDDVRFGLVKGNTSVTVKNASETVKPTIIHNIYGGGAYGSVGDFNYDENGNITSIKTDAQNKVTTGKAAIYITGGTIGTTGKENGMIFGSSRGDVGDPNSIHNKLAWVYDTHVAIGDTTKTGSDIVTTTPLIKGSIYGGGENGHNFHSSYVRINGGTIGIHDATNEDVVYTDDKEDVSKVTYQGKDYNYPYRGNVYGGGCGTDKYDTNNDNKGDTYNPLAGIVQGDATVCITGGTIIHNVYGAGAMGSVGKFDKNATTNVIAFASGGTTTISISGGTVGVDGTDNGNVFGAARGDETTMQTDVALVKTTDVTISGDATVVWGNVYGGGQIGCVGTFAERPEDGKYIWTSDDQNLNGLSKVTITGGETKGHVFGAGKGKAITFKCEKAMVRETIVSVSNGKVDKNVYGGGEIGRVEEDTDVKIGVGDGTCTPIISGSVYGAGAGLETHGYSALVRHNTTVTVDGGATIGQSVYGGGEIASVGRYGLDDHKMPEILLDGGYCYVTVKGSATIGSTTVQGNVFGACKGVVPHFDKTNADRSKRSRRMTVYNADDFPDGAKIDATTGNASSTTSTGTTWEYYDESVTPKLVWEYFQEEDGYNKYLETLALATHPEVTIDGGATVNGSVYGGGEMGLTKGSVYVNILGGTITKDVYGGGALANTNTTSAVGVLVDGVPQKNTDGSYQTTTVHPKTTVNLLGGSMRDAYGGGLGQLAVAAQGTEGQTGYQAAVSAIEAKVFGDVKVNLNGLQAATDINTTLLSSLTTGGKLVADGSRYNVKSSAKGAVVNRVFGCNNLNGTPTKKVQVYVFGTQKSDKTQLNAKADKNKGIYDVQAVYGGGNLSPYVPADALLAYNETNKATVDAARPEVYIDGCDLTSIKQVYGGGNAASVPATFVEINGTYEIDEVFGGGNGADNYSLNEGGTDVWYQNPGANVGYFDYTNTTTSGSKPGSISSPYYLAVDDSNFDTKDERLADNTTAAAIRYGSGIARLVVYGGTIHTSYGGSNARGNVRTLLSSLYSANGGCPMAVGRSYGGGNNAKSDGEVDMVADCAHGIEEMFGGAENADVDNDINLRITNGSSLKRVFGGNNTSGAINGSITVTIEEGGCEPIKIGHLYLGGFLAPYSVYGYERNDDGSYKTEPVKYIDANGAEQTLNQRIPLTADKVAADFVPKADPCLYVISATRIDSIFGGGYQAKLIGNPRVNINMKQGKVLLTRTGTEGSYVYTDAMGTEYTENVTSETTGEGASAVTKYYATLPLGTIGTVYGGGNMADVLGDTYVEIGTGTCVTSWDADGKAVYTPVTPARNGAKITGNVFGGGKGKADSFKCPKAMVGVEDKGFGSTNVIIGNGTVGALDEDGKLVEGTGNVYGGGEIGRVELNTTVTIGKEGDEASAPEIRGYVFGGGKGLETHGYSALVRGNPAVTIQGGAKIGKSVYGGGEIASVGNFFVKGVTYPAELNAPTPPENIPDGMPYALKLENSGKCTVIVRDKAEIGPDNMKMEKRDEQNNLLRPDDKGHVFGAGKGILPYEATNDPKRMNKNSEWESYANNESGYITFIETLGMTASTDVTITDNAFVKGSVYGGSENGHVLHNTKVTIAEKCQIGNGDGVNRRYTDDEWNSESLAECASWPFGKQTGTDNNNKPIMKYLPYDVYDYVDPTAANPVPKAASDGHTYYGNVFGGGSGIFPYKKKAGWLKNDAKSAEVGQPVDKDGYSDGVWLRSAGAVYGNTEVNIIGGHILTSVYGGNECTDVTGTSTVKMSGGTLGVPRTEQQMKDHPVTCYLFGAGKGDQRINFNTWTNIASVNVDITGGRIFGSVFGGGEDGHVLGDVTMSISEADANKPTKIGTTGTSYVDGNVFGGGRGFSGDAQTAGTVGGNVNLNISGGTMLGSVYGGGRLASVGTMFEFPTLDDGNPNPEYGQFKEDGNGKTYGHVTIYITGGIIGNTVGNRESGNVFGGSMGRLELLNGTRNPIWPKMAQVKSSAVTVSGDAVIRRSVYGGGELGTVRDNAVVTIDGGTVRRDVFGGGYGSEDKNHTIFTTPELKAANADPTKPESYENHTYAFTPMQFAGCVGKSTTVNVNGGYIRKSVYGGGEMASVGVINYRAAEATSEIAADKVKIGPIDGKTYYYENMVKHGDATKEFALSWPYEFEYVPGYNGATHVNITGGRLGLKDSDEDNTDIKADNGDVYGAGKGKAGDYKDFLFCANVGSTDVKIAYTTTLEAYSSDGDLIAGAVYGGGEDGHVMGDTKLTMSGGLVYHSLYGAGSGKGKFPATLKKIGKEETYDTNIYSITAGKVFGNSTVEMSGGYVVRNIYGGGNMGSVGKGNYAGGDDDYSTSGYGEKVDKLWSGGGKFSEAFLNSGKCTVKITGGTIGYIDTETPSESMYPKNSTASLPYGNVFGGCRGESAPNISETPRYLYSPEFFVGYANETEVTIGGNTKILGSVYGGGMDGHVRRDAHVIINGGEIGLPFTEANQNNVVKTSDPNHIQWLARGNVYGSGSGIGQYKYDFDYDGKYESTVTYNGKQTKEEDFSTSAGSVTRFTTVDINGGTIHRNVYGGGSLSSIGAPKIGQSYNLYCKGDTEADHGEGKQTLNEVNISGGQIGDEVSRAADYGGHVFGGSRGDASLNTTTFSTSMFTKVNMGGGKVLGSVFGGGEVGIIKGSVVVDVTGGEIESDVYGGGALANTNTANPEGVTDQYTTTVNLLGGTINDAFGGGLGQKKGANGATSDIEAIVYGDVHLNLNGLESADYVPAIHSSLATDVDDTDGKYYLAKDGCVVTGNVFGCNNYNGTPMGHSKVHVFKTKAKTYQVADGYDVSAVFGGGNQADYVPTDTKQTTEVIIEGCDLTSIQEVYGGGYGAAVPATSVLIKGTKIIDNVYGGGYGAGTDNPGANVGSRTGGAAYTSGEGKAVVQLMAGKVNNVYGGSNTKGDILNGSSVTNVANDGGPGCCTELSVEEIYGGGKSADMYGGAEICLSCMPNDWIGAIYAGAENANVGHDISLTLTSGKFEHVFGGNKSGGKVEGSIEVNIEENPECSTPVIIGELYGGGNLAPYSIYGYYQDGTDSQGKPVYKPRTKEMYDRMSEQEKLDEGIHSGPHNSPRINVRAFTSIGTIFGGGLGESAVMIGNPTVNINVVEGGRAYAGETQELGDGTTVTLYKREAGAKIGAIGNVFGGGNAAEVIGNTTVNVGTTTEEQMVSLQTKDEQGNVIVVKKPVIGADIRGNVYGGGNAAEVTGKTNVVIGKKASE